MRPWAVRSIDLLHVLVGSMILSGCSRSPRAEPTDPAAGSTGSAATAVASVTSAPPALGASAAPPPSASPLSFPPPSHSGPARPRPEAQTSIALSGGGKLGEGKTSAVTPASVGLPAVDFGPPGPLVVHGYPAPLELGMADYVTDVGYTANGSEAIACGYLDPSGVSCYVNGGEGTRAYSSIWDGGEDPQSHQMGAPLQAAIGELAKGKHSTLGKKGEALLPPPVVATWPYARDISLNVAAGGIIRLGGRLGDEAPVFSVTVKVTKKGREDVSYTGSVNAIVTSPKQDELAVIGAFFCGEWCNEIVVARVGYGVIASLVYNDTGFRHHQKKDYAASRDLFLKATWANPRAPLPPYNLACAYALLGDAANSEKALKLAISVGGEGVKARAKKDADFKAVLAAPWFRALVGLGGKRVRGSLTREREPEFAPGASQLWLTETCWGEAGLTRSPSDTFGLIWGTWCSGTQSFTSTSYGGSASKKTLILSASWG
jgi:hypothetical protein